VKKALRGKLTTTVDGTKNKNEGHFENITGGTHLVRERRGKKNRLSGKKRSTIVNNGGVRMSKGEKEKPRRKGGGIKSGKNATPRSKAIKKSKVYPRRLALKRAVGKGGVVVTYGDGGEMTWLP